MRTELTYTLTLDDLHEYQKAQSSGQLSGTGHKPRRSLRRLIIWLVIFVTSLAVYAALQIDISSPQRLEDQLQTVFLGLLPFVILAVFVAAVVFRLRFTKSTAFSMMKLNPHLTVPKRTVISDDGLHMAARTETHLMQWSHFTHLAETQNLLILMVSHLVGHIVPKRAFPSPAALDEFRAFAQSHIGNAPIGFPIEPPQAPSPRADHHP
jgi:hypothetical protein